MQKSIASFFESSNKRPRPSSTEEGKKTEKKEAEKPEEEEEETQTKKPKTESSSSSTTPTKTSASSASPSSSSSSSTTTSSSSASISTSSSAGLTTDDKISALPENVKSICSLELETMDPSWLSLLLNEFKQPYFLQLKDRLQQAKAKGETIYPPENEIYSWARYCPFDDVRVVILGQDPYHGAGQAHGLAFSVKPGVRVPPSLLNMYKELETDIEGFKRPKHGNLEGWSKQGVLMLNTTLTVKSGNPNSHASFGWQTFTTKVIDLLNKRGEHIVFMLWGSHAQKNAKGLNEGKHLVLKCAHPSPFSADSGFFGCKHFSRANAFLRKVGRKEIDWSAL